MAALLIGYDLNRPGQDYPALWDKLKSYGAWWHYLDSTWIVRTSLTPKQVRDDLKALIDSNDEVLVIDVTGRSWAGQGFPQRAYDWLQNNM